MKQNMARGALPSCVFLILSACVTTPTAQEKVGMQQRMYSATCSATFDAARTVLADQGFAFASIDSGAKLIVTEPKSAGSSTGSMFLAAAIGAPPIKWNISMRCDGGSAVTARLFNVMSNGTSAEMLNGDSVAQAYADFFRRMDDKLRVRR